MFGRALVLLLASLAAVLPGDAEAFVRTMSESGRPLYWPSPTFPVSVNPVNASGLSSAQVTATLQPAFAAWSVPGSRVNVAYAQSSGFPAASALDGVNNVYFGSRGGRLLDYGVVALTEVLYYVSSGQIAEADMVFNDQQFLFTDHAGDTGQVIDGRTAIYLRDVATHEAGHALGLDHSTLNLSSLIYTAFSGQYSISQDDRTSMLEMYPASVPTGALSGRVAGSAGGVFGAQVSAINLATGQVQAAGLTNGDGSFRLGELPDGAYSVFAEPFGTDPSTISPYYQNVDHHFCSAGARFRRRFYGACGGNAAAVVNVAGGAGIALGTLAPSCAPMGNPGGAPTTIATAREVSGGRGALFGTLAPGDVHYYHLTGVTGALAARALSYSLYSPVDVRVDFLDSTGAPLAGATSVDNVQDPMPGGFKNYDSSATATATGGDYFVRVTAASTRLYPNLFPAGYELADSYGHYLLALSVDGDFGDTGATDMSACATLNNRAQNAVYRTPASSGGGGGGGCGTLGGPGGGGGAGGGPGPVGLTLLAALLAHLGLAIGRRPALRLVRRRR